MEKFIYLKNNLNDLDLEENDIGTIVKKINSNIFLINFLRTNREEKIFNNQFNEFDINESGDLKKFKVCDRCFKRLPTDEFSNNRIKKGGVITKRPSCKSCRKVKDGKSISSSDRKKWEKNKPIHNSLFQCQICKKNLIVGVSKIVLDHNHKTGKVRGYICESCNTGIGRFDDDPNIVKNAIDWLSEN